LNNAKKNLKKKRSQKTAQLKKMQERIKKKREMRAKATKSERKAILLGETKSLQEDIDVKRKMFDVQIEELVEKIELIEREKVNKVKDIDDKILEKTNELRQFSSSTQWGMHRDLWQEINQYIDSFLDENLNMNISVGDESEDDDSTISRWINTPNQWQIGNLSYTYWAKIYKNDAPLGLAYHLGLAIAKKFEWYGKNVLDESLAESLKKPCAVVWASQDVKSVRKIDIDGQLGKKRGELLSTILVDYENELLDIGANVNCLKKRDINEDVDLIKWQHNDKEYFMPLEVYLKSKDDYELICIHSRIWTLDSFIKHGQVNLESINKYKRDMSIIIPILCNSVTMLNDYALEIGINQETIDERFDQFNRLTKVMFIEYKKLYPLGTPFQPSKEEIMRWRVYAREELGLDSDYLYGMIFDKFRWSSRSSNK